MLTSLQRGSQAVGRPTSWISPMMKETRYIEILNSSLVYFLVPILASSQRHIMRSSKILDFNLSVYPVFNLLQPFSPPRKREGGVSVWWSYRQSKRKLSTERLLVDLRIWSLSFYRRKTAGKFCKNVLGLRETKFWIQSLF